jgi:biotin carboxyl carrier protein
MRYVARIAGVTHTVELRENGHERQVELDGRALTVDWQRIGGSQPHEPGDASTPAQHFSLLVGGHSYEAYARVLDGGPGAAEGQEQAIEIMIAGQPYLVTIQDERSQALTSLASGRHVSGDAAIRAPMPGLVSNVLAAVGDEVTRGQNIVVLEAMKMENDLTAPRAGIVKAVHVTKGQTVNQDAVLAIVGDADAVATAADEDE